GPEGYVFESNSSGGIPVSAPENACLARHCRVDKWGGERQPKTELRMVCRFPDFALNIARIVDQPCGGANNTDVRMRIEKLLLAHESVGTACIIGVHSKHHAASLIGEGDVDKVVKDVRQTSVYFEPDNFYLFGGL